MINEHKRKFKQIVSWQNQASLWNDARYDTFSKSLMMITILWNIHSFHYTAFFCGWLLVWIESAKHEIWPEHKQQTGPSNCTS